MLQRRLAVLILALGATACGKPPQPPTQPPANMAHGPQSLPLAARPMAAVELIEREGRGFVTGTGERHAHVYVMFDPQNVSAQMLAEAKRLTPLVKMTWVPVGLTNEGTQLAAKLLVDQDPATMLEALAANKGKATGAPPPTEAGLFAAVKNQALMQRLDARQLPYIVGRSSDNRTVTRDYILQAAPLIIRLGLSPSN